MSGHQPNYAKVPVPHMAAGLQRYIERGIPPGHFLTALLSNDLIGAYNRADDENTAAMRLWVRFMYWELPHGSYGSPQAVEAWIESHGAAREAQNAQAK